MSKKTRLAPLGATYKQEVRLRRVRPKPDAAPNGAKRVLFNRGYKDFAPTALGSERHDSRLSESANLSPFDALEACSGQAFHQSRLS